MVDYRTLNAITNKNRTAVTRTDEIFDRVSRAKYLSKMDLKTGLHQTRLREGDAEKTAFTTKYGHFDYVVMAMGLCNAPATFESLMNHVLGEFIDEFVVVYLDDHLIFSDSEADHLEHIRKVLHRLEKHQLFVSPAKCKFFQPEMSFLGLVLGQGGIRVCPDKVRAVREWRKPVDVSQLRSFLVLVTFSKRFVEGFAEIATPLTNLTKKNGSISAWDAACDVAFRSLKHALSRALILTAPD